MEADWSEATRITLPGLTPNAPPSTLTTFAFDPSEELLWTGNDHGRVTSFFGLELQKYTSYFGHVSSSSRRSPGDAPVLQLLFCDKGVISVSSRSVHLSSRRGLAQWHISPPTMKDLRCMSFTGRDATELLVAGCQSQMYRIDVEKGTVLETLTPATPAPYTLMRLAGQYICAACQDGSIHVLDPKSLTLVISWKAYAGPVNDMDARGDYLLTCGWAQMQYQGLSLERLVRVFDLKAQKPAPPVPFQSGAAHVRMHPKLSSTCIVVSQSGLIHSIDIQNPDMPTMRYANSFDVQFLGLELMPSGKGFALADSQSQITLWGSPSKLMFTEYSKPTEFAEPNGVHKQLEWTAEAPLNMIGMPHYREALLSGWPNSLLHQVGLPPQKVIEPLDVSYRPFEYGSVGPNPKKAKRYEAAKAQQKLSDPLAAPKFLSEKPREEDASHGTDRRMSEDLIKALDKAKLDGLSTSDAKFLYRVVEIKYSRFGVEDFDFRYYNKTQYAGLETHIVNSYANPLLQILRFTPYARNLALHHTARDCRLEDCLMCELGFLIDMLEKAKAPNCQATNFLKALSRQPDAPAQNILEENNTGNPLTTMIQNLNRFLLHRMEDNFKWVAPSLDNFHRAFGTIGLDFTQCGHCSYESRKDKVWYTHDLVYPPRAQKGRFSPHPFSQVLKASIERHNQHRGWCLRCNGYKPMVSNRAIHCLPATLMLNAAINTEAARSFWSQRNVLPDEIGVIVNNGRFFSYEGSDLQFQLQRGQYNITVYKLVGVVAEAKTGENEKSHLVASINTGVANPGRSESQGSDWYLFNDFLVHQLRWQDALHFNPEWKLPSVITYQIKSGSNVIDNSWKSAIDTSILFRSPTQPGLAHFRALSRDEPLPDSSWHVGIDAEFVRLLREEIDVGADGSRTMTRPARSGLARVSVLRGDGMDQELPFIDDYIAIDDPIDDYLTQYSGLHEGDLTVGKSRFQLVSLKEVYKKLWVLLNLGCSFVGHGLSSDFRIINMHVPDSQVIDTQELFTLGSRARRKLSLRFLAWIVLKEEVQKNADMGHDSIEDARTALKLWRKYLEFQNAGVLETIMDEVWHKGRSTDFKVPSDLSNARRPNHPETPVASAPGTPSRQPVRLATPARSEFGSPSKGLT